MSTDKQPLVGSNAPPSAPPMAPPPYTQGGYGGAVPGGGYGGAVPGGGYGGAVPGGGYVGGPAYGYGGQTQTNNTTVVVTQARPVTRTVEVAIKPPNYVVLSVLNMLFCCFLFGLIALVMGIQSDSAWARGDHSEAHRLSMTARRWNMIGIVGGFFFTAAWVIAVISINVSLSAR